MNNERVPLHENSWQLTKDMASRGLTFYVSCPNWEHIYVASPLKHCTAVERCKWRTHTSSSIGWTWPIIKTNFHCEANMCQRANMLLLACFPCFCTKRNPTLAPSYISWDNYFLCAWSRWNINISNHSYQKTIFTIISLTMENIWRWIGRESPCGR